MASEHRYVGSFGSTWPGHDHVRIDIDEVEARRVAITELLADVFIPEGGAFGDHSLHQ